MFIAGIIPGVLVSSKSLLINPDFLPNPDRLGQAPIQFSLVMLVSLALGMFSPPVGATLFISCYIAKVGIEKAVIDIMAYFLAELLSCC